MRTALSARSERTFVDRHSGRGAVTMRRTRIVSVVRRQLQERPILVSVLATAIAAIAVLAIARVTGPSLSTSGETLTIEESMNLEGENGATPGCWRRARMEPGQRLRLPPAAKTSAA